jgi:hypothetical protein
MQAGFEKCFSARFYATGADAPYMERDPVAKRSLRSNKSAGYLVHVPLGQGRPHLLAIFGMNGPMSLLWADRLRKMPELAWAQGAQSSDGGDIGDESNSGKADNIQVLRRLESGYRRKMQVVIWRKNKFRPKPVAVGIPVA